MYRAPYRSEEVRGTQEPTRKSGVWGTRPLDVRRKAAATGKGTRTEVCATQRVGSWFLIADY